MLARFPKDDRRIAWTRHIKNKMIYYGLSESRIRSVFNSPKRREEGIAEGTSAAMKPVASKKRPEEIWVMYKKLTNDKQLTTKNKKQKTENSKPYSLNPKPLQILMISAWRYPGITKPGKAIHIPEDALEELAKNL